MTLLVLAVLSAFAIYIMKPEERVRFARMALRQLHQLTDAAARRAAKDDPFTEALRERTRWPLVVPALIAYNLIVFVSMLFGSGAFSEPETLIRWGANFGPRTTNGEWGRLMLSMFVHAGFLHLLATIVGLVQVGLIVERLVGYLTFAAVYLMSGFFASVISLWMHPLNVSIGASGAVFGIYGFLAAIAILGRQRPTGVTLPLETIKSFAPTAGVFIVYNLFSGATPFHAEVAGFVTGFVAAVVVTADLRERKPAPRRVVAAVATTFALAMALAIPLHGITDVRPEIEWIVRLEEGTAARYRTAVEQFRKGIISARELAEVIERNIVPELTSARLRLLALNRVPREHQPLLDCAEEFLRLRDESWRLRAKALNGNNMSVLRQADQIEMTSLQTFEKMKPADHQ